MASGAQLLRVCLVGSGNWGSAVAKIIGNNVRRLADFSEEVTMYVYEEIVEGEKLSDVINSRHENIKYLPGIKLPDNVRADPDLVSSAREADVLVFVVPHQFVPGICSKLKGTLRPGAVGVSLIKGLDCRPGGSLELVSEQIGRSLELPMSVLMGANIATEVAQESHCEATLGCRSSEQSESLHALKRTSLLAIRPLFRRHAAEAVLHRVLQSGGGSRPGGSGAVRRPEERGGLRGGVRGRNGSGI